MFGFRYVAIFQVVIVGFRDHRCYPVGLSDEAQKVVKLILFGLIFRAPFFQKKGAPRARGACKKRSLAPYLPRTARGSE